MSEPQLALFVMAVSEPLIAFFGLLAAAVVFGLFAVISNTADTQGKLMLAAGALITLAVGGGFSAVVADKAADDAASDAASDVQQQVERQVDRAVEATPTP